MTNSYFLLGILLTHAPNAEAQANVSATYNRMQFNGETEKTMEKQLVNALADGLNHGNWPWGHSCNFGGCAICNPEVMGR